MACAIAHFLGSAARFVTAGPAGRLPHTLRESPVIEVQHLTKRYGRVTAVDDVSFRVERGEILGFLGPERRRQDDDDADPHRLHAGHRGQGDRRRLRRVRPADRGQAPHRLSAGDAAALPRHDGRASICRSSPRSRACRRPSGASAIQAVMERTRIADMADRQCAQAVEGLPAARRPGAGAHPQPRRADPRRADRRPRSEADHRDAPARSRSSPATTPSS